jgi:hypothetical protein
VRASAAPGSPISVHGTCKICGSLPVPVVFGRCRSVRLLHLAAAPDPEIRIWGSACKEGGMSPALRRSARPRRAQRTVYPAVLSNGVHVQVT